MYTDLYSSITEYIKNYPCIKSGSKGLSVAGFMQYANKFIDEVYANEQKELKEKLESKVDSDQIVHVLGDSETKIISQKGLANLLKSYIQSVETGDQVLDNIDGTVHIPTATAVSLGLVKSSSDITNEDSISVDENGEMTVNNLNIMKLVQYEGDTVILDGGIASENNTS